MRTRLQVSDMNPCRIWIWSLSNVGLTKKEKVSKKKESLRIITRCLGPYGDVTLVLRENEMEKIVLPLKLPAGIVS